MTVFVFVSAVVLLSILWDNTEDFRKELMKELGLNNK